MRLCNIFIQYFLLIYFCLCHDINHADPATVKQTESSVTVDPLSKTIEATNVQKNDHVYTTPSVPIQNDIASPSTPSSIIDTAKIIPFSNELAPPVQIQSNSQPIKIISDDQIKEQTSFTHPKSHIPSPSNSDQSSQIPLKSTTIETTTVQNESQSSTPRHPQRTHIHPRHIQTEDKIDQSEKTTEQSVPLENKTQSNVSTLLENTSQTNHSISISPDKNRQICWHLPKTFQPSIELFENQLFRLINTLPDFLQTIFFGRIDDREVLMNTMWFGSICTMCFLFIFLFLSMGTRRLKQSKHEKEIRSRCQQLQQHNNQIQLERATFERQNQKLSEQIDELKNLSVRDTDEDIFALRTECRRFEEDAKTVRIERDVLQQDIDQKQNLLQKYEYDMKGQGDMIAYLNNQIFQLKQDSEKERTTAHRLQSSDLSLERSEKSQEIIQELKSEITQLKQDKFTDKDQLKEIREHTNQLDLENNQLTERMKQLKDLLEQRDQTIKRLHETIQTIDHFESEELLSILTKSSSDNQDFLSIVDNDIKKSSQHIHDLHSEIDEKTRRIKEIETLFKQEKDRCREIETKLKVVLELRERDAHLHIRQLGQTDAELRKARTDTDRVRILQQQLELKQQQFDDIQKVLSTEQIKFNEECSKLQHETHEKWMEVKRLTRELDASKKECEGLRRQITKYANSDRSSQEKSMMKLFPQQYGGSETSSTSPIPYQQGENFRSLDRQRNDSGATSPSEMLIPRPPLFGLSRPPFFPSHFMGPPPPNPFMMHPRFPMSIPSPHLIINDSDANSSQIVDSSNLTPNSISVDAQSSGAVSPPAGNDEKQNKTKKPKKSLKKKTRTSAMKEDV